MANAGERGGEGDWAVVDGSWSVRDSSIRSGSEDVSDIAEGVCRDEDGRSEEGVVSGREHE